MSQNITIDEALKLAQQHHVAGRLQEAEQLYRQILQQVPNQPDALHLLGILAIQVNRPDVAVELISRAIAIQPNQAGYHSNLAEAHRKMGNLEAAEAECRQAIALNPQLAPAHANLGTILIDRQQPQDAEAALSKALEINPNLPGALSAMTAVSVGLGKIDQAIEHGQRAIAAAPGDAVAHNNLARALELAGDLEQAETHYRRGVELDPQNADVQANLGEIVRQRGDILQAVQWWRKAIAIHPNHSRAGWALALGLLTLGEYDEGWKLYARRFEFGQAAESRREYSVPHWTGQDLTGKTILLYPEQGYGDVIMFSRFVDVLANKGARVLLQAQPEMVGLMKNVQGVSQALGSGEPLPPFDFHQSLLTIPSVIGLRTDTIPATVPYIHVEPAQREAMAKHMAVDSSKRKIGLVWAGRTDSTERGKRPIPLRLLEPILQLPGVTFFSLQLGSAASQLSQVSTSMPIVDLSSHLHDFADTAAAISNLDLLISVDTAAAHLAGAIGAKVWTLLPFAADFRWFLDREDSPWYPTMRLFRQRHRGDWDEVISRVRDELLKFSS